MNKHPDSPHDDDDDEMPDASELLDFELIAKSEPEKGRSLWLWVVLILVLAGGAGAGWMYLQDATDQTAGADGVPLILAPKFNVKEKPADPGGMDVPDRDMLVYNRMVGEGGNPPEGVERLLPPPETPIEPPREVAPVSEPQETAPRDAAAQPAPPPAPLVPEAKDAKPEPASQSAAQATPGAGAAPVPAPAPSASRPSTPPLPPSAPVASAPAPAAKPAAPAAPTETAAKPVFKATAPAGQGYLVQLSAVRTEPAARAEWARLMKAHSDVLGGLDSVIQRADLGAKGIFYRVRAGWFSSRAEAKAVCDELIRRNVGCIIAKP